MCSFNKGVFFNRNTNNKPKMSMWIYFTLVVSCSYISGSDAKSFEICFTQSSITADYSCGSGERIHVDSILYQEASLSCLSIPGGCQLLLENSYDGLTTSCNGYNGTCDEIISDFLFTNVCKNKNASIATVTYECLHETSFGICKEMTSNNNDVVYLNSPKYPRETVNDAVDVTDNCMCEIFGTQLSVELLEIYFLFDLEVRANLTLIGDSQSWTTSSHVFLMYNVKVLNNQNNISLSLNTKGQTSQDVWIRITGIGEITVACNGAAFTTTTTTGTTTSTGTSIPVTGRQTSSLGSTSSVGISTSSIYHHSSLTTILTTETSTHPSNTTSLKELDNKEGSSIGGIVAGCVVGSLVIIAVIVVIIVFKRRRRRKPYKEGAYDDPDKALEDYRKTLAAREDLEASEPPSSPQYFELEPFQSQNNNINDPKQNTSGNADTALPYTNKKLEAIYSQVIPKKFISTRDMREAEKKQTKQQKGSTGKENFGYENDESPAYSEVKDSINGENSKKMLISEEEEGPPEDESPPVPPREYDVQEESQELDLQESRSRLDHNDLPSAEGRRDSGDGLIDNAKFESDQLDEDGRYASVDDLGHASRGDKDMRKRPDDDDDDDELVMMDNVLYERLPSDGKQYSSIDNDEDKRVSPKGKHVVSRDKKMASNDKGKAKRDKRTTSKDKDKAARDKTSKDKSKRVQLKQDNNYVETPGADVLKLNLNSGYEEVMI